MFTIKTIPHSKQRYPTVGDWILKQNGDISILVSDMHNPDYEFMVGVHELIEVYLCKKRGISEDAVNRFDIAFERMRDKFPDVVGDKEPGDDKKAPYRKEHFFATSIERLICAELGINWQTYESCVNNL